MEAWIWKQETCRRGAAIVLAIEVHQHSSNHAETPLFLLSSEEALFHRAVLVQRPQRFDLQKTKLGAEGFRFVRPMDTQQRERRNSM
jgi:hypothetical protein